MTSSPLSSANTLKAQSLNLMWTELKRELSMQYSAIPFDSHSTQAFAQLEQGLDDLLDMYLHHANELLSKICYTSDMSRNLAEGLIHYTVVYGLNCRRLKTVLWNTKACNEKWWRVALGISIVLVPDIKGPKAIADLNSTSQKHQWSLSSKPWRNQYHVTDVEDLTSKTTTKTIKVTTVISSKTRCPYCKTTREAITYNNFCNNRNKSNIFPQELYHSRSFNKLGQVMTCW